MDIWTTASHIERLTNALDKPLNKLGETWLIITNVFKAQREIDTNPGLVWIPIANFFLIPFTIVITYIWSVMLGHVEPDFPYISTAGATPPESCFFAQLLNIVAVTLSAFVWVRHKEVEAHVEKYDPTAIKLIEKSRQSSYFGYAGAVGMSMVGNFQTTNVPTLHLVGAFLAFGIGTVYLWLQSFLSYALVPHQTSRNVAHLRLGCSIVASVMIVVTILFSSMHDMANKGDTPTYWGGASDPGWWDESNKWAWHVIATASEWVMAGAFCSFCISFAPEYKRLNLCGASVEFDRDRRQIRKGKVQLTDSSITVIRM